MNKMFLAMLSIAIANPAAAQSPTMTEQRKGIAKLDWNAKPRAFSNGDYEQLLSCTLSRHPKETRGYAEYHLHRRDAQTPEQNERDPNSQLLMPALEGCLQIENGEPFPFSLDQLIADWGIAHSMVVVDAASLAKCAAINNVEAASGYVAVAKNPIMRAKSLSMMQAALTMPPCRPVKPFFFRRSRTNCSLCSSKNWQLSKKCPDRAVRGLRFQPHIGHSHFSLGGKLGTSKRLTRVKLAMDDVERLFGRK